MLPLRTGGVVVLRWCVGVVGQPPDLRMRCSGCESTSDLMLVISLPDLMLARPRHTISLHLLTPSLRTHSLYHVVAHALLYSAVLLCIHSILPGAWVCMYWLPLRLYVLVRSSILYVL